MTTRVSSLVEINKAFTNAYFTYCGGLLPELLLVTWNSGSDVKTDLERIRRAKHPTNDEVLPAMVISRTGIAKDAFGARVDNYKYKAYHKNATTGYTDAKYDYRVVNLTYEIRFYCTTMSQAERFIEYLILFNDPSNSFTYNLPWVNDLTFKGTWQNSDPKVSHIPDSNEEGFVYLVSQNINVIASLVSITQTVKIINTIDVKYFNWDEKLVETIHVNSNATLVDTVPPRF